jgi:hypothetical protein
MPIVKQRIIEYCAGAYYQKEIVGYKFRLPNNKEAGKFDVDIMKCIFFSRQKTIQEFDFGAHFNASLQNTVYATKLPI